MNPRDLIPTTEQLKLVRGVEADLLQRRRKGALGAVVAIVAAVSQVVLAALQTNYAANLGQAVKALSEKDFSKAFGPDGLTGPQVVGIFIIVAGALIYFTYRWTSLLLQESKEPFQYTFWIEPFELVKGTPNKRFALEADDRLELLHHDLMERLSLNIRRLSLLNVEVDVAEETRNNLTSHIRIRGSYAIREVKDDKWVLHVMPVIRIGPAGRAEIVADPVKIDLRDGESSTEKKLLATTYNQLVERIYSIVASQIYKQILSDVKSKSKLFPTNYLRAVALYHEAVDFERSNTIDAYDSAIELYRQSKHHFETRTFTWLPRALVKIPVLPLWKLAKGSLLADARIRVGLARSLIYRRLVSALSGRNQNVLFEIPSELARVIQNLTALQYRITPKSWKLRARAAEDRPGREQVDAMARADSNDASAKDRSGQEKLSSPTTPSRDRSDDSPDPSAQQDYRALMTFLTFRGGVSLKRSFDMQRATLFDAYAVLALAHSYLQSPTAAEEMLKRAKATNPLLSQRSPIWFLATAEIQPDIDKKLLFLTQAAELDSKFEIAQYRLAQFSEMRLRRRGEIRKERVSGVIKQYEDVLTMNPGNIGALSAQGYLWWLVGDQEAAQKKLEEGCQTRAIVRQTFVGDLFYGLARIAAENGQFNRSYDLYTQAILADPEVACYSAVASTKVIQQNYDYIDSNLHRRYEGFYRRTSRAIKNLLELKEKERLDKDQLAVSDRVLKSVRSFVLNDYGNACLSYFLRFGEPQKLRKAIEAYEAATGDNEENFVAYYNLSNAYAWDDSGPRGSADLLENAEKMAPTWPALLIASMRSRVERAQERVKKNKSELEAVEKQLLETSREVVEQVRLSWHLKEEERYSPAPEGAAAAISSSKPEVSVTAAESKGPSVEPRASQKYKDLELQMEQLQKNLEGSRKTLNNKVFPQITSKTMSRTKWSSVLPGLKLDYDGGGVKELREARIRSDGLDEDDLAALQVWARTLSTNTESESALVAAEQLCEYIEKFYHENFETKQTLYAVYASLENVRTPLLEMHNLKDVQGIAQKICSSPEAHHQYLRSQFSDSSQYFEVYAKSTLPPDALNRVLLAEMNRIITDTALADQESFKSLKKQLPTGRLGFRKPTNTNRVRVNRQLLKLAFPAELRIGKEISDEVMDVYQTKRAACGASLQKIINGWLEGDPINFADLRWATDFTDIFNPKQRRSALKNAIAIEPENGAYYHLFGTWRDRRKFFKLATQCHAVACEKTPREHSYFYSLGTSNYRQQKYVEAIDAFREAGRLAPKDHGYRNALGNSYYDAGKNDDAAKSYQKAIDLSQGVAVYYSNLSLALQNLNQWEKAIEACQGAIKIDPQASFSRQLATIHSLQGNDYFGQGNFTSAVESYLKAIELVAKIGVYHGNLSRAYEELKDWKKAIAACEEAIKVDSQNASYPAQLANIYNSRGTEYFNDQNYIAAKESYEEATRRGPDTAIYHANLGAALSGLKDWDRAVQEYEEAIRLEPENVYHKNQLAIVYNARGNHSFGKPDYSEARKFYEKAIELAPSPAIFHSNLSIALRRLAEWDSAEEEGKKAIELEPEVSEHRELLALVHNDRGVKYYEEGDYKKAIEQYGAALAIYDGDALVHSNLALAWADLNGHEPASDNLEKAKAALQKAIDLKPDNVDYRNRMTQLQDLMTPVRNMR